MLMEPGSLILLLDSCSVSLRRPFLIIFCTFLYLFSESGVSFSTLFVPSLLPIFPLHPSPLSHPASRLQAGVSTPLSDLQNIFFLFCDLFLLLMQFVYVRGMCGVL